MPVYPPVSKVLRIDFVQSKGSDVRCRDRIFVQFTGAAAAAADVTTLLTNISAAWATNISPLQDTATALTSIVATDLTSATGVQLINSTLHNGTRAGTGLSGGVTSVIRFKVLRRYRGGHPRIYLMCGVGTDTASAQQWTSAFLGSLLSGWQAFITAIGTGVPAGLGTLSHVNVSYFAGFTAKQQPSGRFRNIPNFRPGGPAVDTVSAYSINPNFGSQRRRNLQSP